MNLEHIGLNVPDPVGAAQWYCQNLGMQVMRKFGPPINAHFLADSRGEMMIEIYSNTKAPIPDYRAMNTLVLHLAFFADDVPATRERLLKAGATAEGEAFVSDQGDHLAMLRDPWGLPIQLVSRAHPMI